MHGARLVGRLGWLIVLGGALFGGVARAAEVAASGPSECPDSAELGFRVARNVGISLAQAPAVKFVVEMQRTGGAYAARLRVAGDTGAEEKERALSGADCAELADAVVVAMTLALGAAAASQAEAPAAKAAPEPVPAVETHASEAAPNAAASDDEPAPEQDAADASTLRPSLSLGALLDVGSLPHPGFGAVVGVELGWQRFQLRALGTILFEQHTDLGGGPASAPPGADLQLFAGSLLGCTTSVGGRDRSFVVPVCLGITDLEALTGLQYVEYGIAISGNSSLVNVDRLASVETESVILNDNAVLTSSPPCRRWASSSCSWPPATRSSRASPSIYPCTARDQTPWRGRR